MSLCLNAGGMGPIDAESETLIPIGGVFDGPSHSLRGEGFDASEDGTGRGVPIIPIDMRQASRGEKFTNNRADGGAPGTGIGRDGDPSPTIASSHVPAIAALGLMQPAVAFDMRGRDGGARMEGPHETANIRASSGGSSRSYIAQPMAVRRLTPRECERLQGFPDDYTLIPYRGKPAADGPRYKALGNSMAVPVMRWIGQRIQMVNEVRSDE